MLQSESGKGTAVVARVPIRVVLADDHRIVVEGLKRLLDGEFDLVDIVKDGVRLFESARQ